MRSDNGGEYEDFGFKKFCYDSGIKFERIVLGTTQHHRTYEQDIDWESQKHESIGRVTKAVLGRDSQHNNLHYQ